MSIPILKGKNRMKSYGTYDKIRLASPRLMSNEIFVPAHPSSLHIIYKLLVCIKLITLPRHLLE